MTATDTEPLFWLTPKVLIQFRRMTGIPIKTKRRDVTPDGSSVYAIMPGTCPGIHAVQKRECLEVCAIGRTSRHKQDL